MAGAAAVRSRSALRDMAGFLQAGWRQGGRAGGFDTDRLIESPSNDNIDSGRDIIHWQ